MSPLSVNQETDFAQKAGNASVSLAETHGGNYFRRSKFVTLTSASETLAFPALFHSRRSDALNELFLSEEK